MAKIVRIVVGAYVALVASVASLALVPVANATPVDDATGVSYASDASVQRCYEDFSCDSDAYQSDAWGWRIANAGL